MRKMRKNILAREEPLLAKLLRKFKRVPAKLNTPQEIFLLLVDNILKRVFKFNPQWRQKKMTQRILSSFGYKKVDCYQFKGIRLPLLDYETEHHFFGHVFEDVYSSYLYFDDCYDEERIGSYDLLLLEGLYGLKNDQVDVRVSAGDIVIDAGSWIGDFAAYASVKGATVFAFEPTDPAYSYLKETARLNPNIYPVRRGLGNVICKANMKNNPDFTLGNSISEEDGEEIEVTTIDSFVLEQGLTHVDFIKADIEGYERYMLEGAQETLRRFAPKLALCTYHFPDDPEVLAALITKANPAYRIVQRRAKLYASVNASI